MRGNVLKFVRAIACVEMFMAMGYTKFGDSHVNHNGQLLSGDLIAAKEKQFGSFLHEEMHVRHPAPLFAGNVASAGEAREMSVSVLPCADSWSHPPLRACLEQKARTA